MQNHNNGYEIINTEPANDKKNMVLLGNGKDAAADDNAYNASASSSLYDCGYHCLSKRIKCQLLQKYAEIDKFFVVLCAIIFFHSAIQEIFVYLVFTDNKYNVSPTVANYLVLWDGIVQAVFAVIIAHYGRNGHFPSWFGIFGIIQAAACCLFSITDLEQAKDLSVTNHTSLSLCEYGHRRDVHPKWSKSWTLFFALFGFQSICTLCFACFITLTFVYLDNNVRSNRLPALIGLVAGMKYTGIMTVRLGMWLKNELEFTNINIYNWYVLGIPLLILSAIIPLFPDLYSRPSTTTAVGSFRRKTNQRIIRQNSYQAEMTGTTALSNILKNKTAMFNMAAIALVQTVAFNSSNLEDDYLKSVFFMPNSANTDFISAIRLPIIVVVVIASGYTVSAIKPRMSRLFGTNVAVIIILVVLSIINMFIRCSQLTLHNEYIGRKSLLEFCNQDCQCMNSQKFSPVCPQGGSIVYYSPCHAGCREAFVNTEFWKCICVRTGTVSADNCKIPSCVFGSTTFRFITLISVVLLSIMIVNNIIILIRAVRLRDRALAIGLQLTTSSIFIHIFGKLYEIIRYQTCTLFEQNGCLMNNGIQFSTYVNLLNICFLMTACGFFTMAWYNVKNIKSFPKYEDRNGTSAEMESLYFSNPRPLLGAKSNSISAIPLSDNNPFKEDIIREFNSMSPKEVAKSEMDLNIILRQNRFDGKGVTIRKNGILTTIL